MVQRLVKESQKGFNGTIGEAERPPFPCGWAGAASAQTLPFLAQQDRTRSGQSVDSFPGNPAAIMTLLLNLESKQPQAHITRFFSTLASWTRKQLLHYITGPARCGQSPRGSQAQHYIHR